MARSTPAAKVRSPLVGWTVALSISESPDMPALGLAREHLEDAMTELARHAVAGGASVAYGGDLRPGGFTRVLFEALDRARRTGEADRVLVRNYLAWPVHAPMASDELKAMARGLDGLAELVLLTKTGARVGLAERGAASPPVIGGDRVAGLTAMRLAMAKETEARVALGGKTSDYGGRMPGIAEEALIQLQSGKPLFVLGGFGGCARDVARVLGLLGAEKDVPAPWPGLDQIGKYHAGALGNGLRPAENERLARTVHVDEAAALVMRGLLRRKGAAMKAGPADQGDGSVR